MGSSKHSGVLALLNRHFVRTGEFPVDDARNLRRAFDLRQKCDSREFVTPEAEQVAEILSDAHRFLQASREACDRLFRDAPDDR